MSDPAIRAFLIISKAFIAGIGGAITVLAYRAFRRTGSAALRSLAIGFGIVTFGGVLSGSLYQAGVDFHVALLAQSSLTALGLALLFGSLYVGKHTND